MVEKMSAEENLPEGPFTAFTQRLPPDGVKVTVRAKFESDPFPPTDMTFHANYWGKDEHALIDPNGRWFWYPDFTEWQMCVDQPMKMMSCLSEWPTTGGCVVKWKNKPTYMEVFLLAFMISLLLWAALIDIVTSLF